MEIGVAPEGYEFVLGDAPAFTLRRFADGKCAVGIKQGASIGSSALLMPLGPSLYACLSPGPSSNSVLTVDEQTVDVFNDIQCARATRSVVCSHTAPEALVERIASKVRETAV